jgi:dihydrofolate reductase
MRKVVAGLSMTLDGVVQSPRDWMMSTPGMDQVINQGISESDGILLGRKTYVEFAAMWPALGDAFPMAKFMNNTPKYVVSSTLESAEWEDSTLLRGDLRAAVTRLKTGEHTPGGEPGMNIKIPGSPTLVRSLLQLGLLDELGLMIHPIVLGAGARLFDPTSDRFDLELKESRTFDNGVISATYRPRAGAAS